MAATSSRITDILQKLRSPEARDSSIVRSTYLDELQGIAEEFQQLEGVQALSEENATPATETPADEANGTPAPPAGSETDTTSADAVPVGTEPASE